MGTVLCNYCTNSKLSSPIQKSDFNIEKINNYLANTQKTSEIKTNQKKTKKIHQKSLKIIINTSILIINILKILTKKIMI